MDVDNITRSANFSTMSLSGSVMSVDQSGQGPHSALTGMSPLAPPQQPTGATSAGSLLGFLVPGGPVRTDFIPDASGMKFTLVLRAPGDLPSPLSSVSDVVCFLLPGAQLPPDHGVVIYWQVSVPNSSTGSSGTGFELLGAVTPQRPSGVFRTGWSTHEQVNSTTSNAPETHVTLGVSIEPMSNIQNLPSQQFEDRLFVAQKIATDLFRFMQSFDTPSGTSGMMTVPTNIFDRWMKRFENRFRRDPTFFLKAEDS
mmetsp:Transcript_31425/g.48216  ORF Transcript_31425/g.48216 Transcript_31425/m.48216 type:complete len:255 (+) Transcript_31425:443-1207(+)